MAPISLSTYLRHYNEYDYWVTARGTILKEEWFLLLLSWGLVVNGKKCVPCIMEEIFI